MITGELKNKIDQIWNAFWSGGIANPLSEAKMKLGFKNSEILETLRS